MLKVNIDEVGGLCSVEARGTPADTINDLLNLIGPLYYEIKRDDPKAAKFFQAALLLHLARREYWERDWTKGGNYSAINIPRRAPEGQS